MYDCDCKEDKKRRAGLDFARINAQGWFRGYEKKSLRLAKETLEAQQDRKLAEWELKVIQVILKYVVSVIENGMVYVLNDYKKATPKVDELGDPYYGLVPTKPSTVSPLHLERNMLYAVSASYQNGKFANIGYFPVHGPVLQFYQYVYHAKCSDRDECLDISTECCRVDLDLLWSPSTIIPKTGSTQFTSTDLNPEECYFCNEGEWCMIPTTDFITERQLLAIARNEHMRQVIAFFQAIKEQRDPLEGLRQVPRRIKDMLETRLPHDIDPKVMSQEPKLMVPTTEVEEFKNLLEGMEINEIDYTSLRLKEIPQEVSALLKIYQSTPSYIPLDIPFCFGGKDTIYQKLYGCKPGIFLQKQSEEVDQDESTVVTSCKMELGLVGEKELNFPVNCVNSREVFNRVDNLMDLQKYRLSIRRGLFRFNEELSDIHEVRTFGKCGLIGSGVIITKKYVNFENANQLPERWEDDSSSLNYQKRQVMKRRSIALGCYIHTKDAKDNVKHDQKLTSQGKESYGELESDSTTVDLLIDFLSHLIFWYLSKEQQFCQETLRHLLLYRMIDQKKQCLQYFCKNRTICNWVPSGVLARYRAHLLQMNRVFVTYFQTYFDMLEEGGLWVHGLSSFEQVGKTNRDYWKIHLDSMQTAQHALKDIKEISSEVNKFCNTGENENHNHSEHMFYVIAKSCLSVDDFSKQVLENYLLGLSDLVKGLQQTEKLAYEGDIHRSKKKRRISPDERSSESAPSELPEIHVSAKSNYRVVQFHAFIRRIVVDMIKSK